MFYDKFKGLCDQKNVKPSRVALECGFSKGSVSHWKNEGTVPQREILIKIAEYFSVSVDYLLGAEEKENPAADSNEALAFALYGGDRTDITPEMLDKVREFARFVRDEERRKKE